MIFTAEVKAALATLRNAAENDFERHRLDVLEKDLTSPPTVEIIDDTHQKFLGISFRKRKEGHYFNPCLSIYRLVWLYHYGEIPQGTIIHHINHNKDDNNISNLTPMYPAEHRKHHGGTSTRENHFICKICGQEFSTTATRACYCPACRKKAYVKPKVIKSEKKPRTKICKVCGKEFPLRKKESLTRGRKTCSSECSKILKDKIASNKRVNHSKICEVCGKPFEYKHKHQKTCSPKCGKKLAGKTQSVIRTNQNKIRIISHCELCGKEISHVPSDKPRFCSRDCLHKFLRVKNTKHGKSGKENRVCKVCGKSYECCKSAKKVWCSPACGKIYRNNH